MGYGITRHTWNCDKQPVQIHNSVQDTESSRITPRCFLSEVGNGEGEIVRRALCWISTRTIQHILCFAGSDFSDFHVSGKCPQHIRAGVRLYHHTDHSVECSNRLNNDISFLPVWLSSRCFNQGRYHRKYYRTQEDSMGLWIYTQKLKQDFAESLQHSRVSIIWKKRPLLQYNNKLTMEVTSTKCYKDSAKSCTHIRS